MDNYAMRVCGTRSRLLVVLAVLILICVGMWLFGLSVVATKILERMASEPTEESAEYEWTCEHCGVYLQAPTMEMLVQGFRIHDDAIYCPGDEDDCEEHYE